MTDKLPENADMLDTESLEETFQLDDAEIADFIARGGEAPSFHTILQVWRDVLEPVDKVSTEKVTPQYASRIISSYTGIDFSDMNEMRDRYYAKIKDLAAIVTAEISTDADCLSYATPAEDAAENAHHYKNVLRDWQLTFMRWELDWDTTSRTAAVELAAISEVHKMFFGNTGLTQFLDNIQFEFTEADQADLAAALDELRGEEK